MGLCEFNDKTRNLKQKVHSFYERYRKEQEAIRQRQEMPKAMRIQQRIKDIWDKNTEWGEGSFGSIWISSKSSYCEEYKELSKQYHRFVFENKKR